MENLPPETLCEEGEAGVIRGLMGSVKVMDVGRLGDCRLKEIFVARGEVGRVAALRGGGMIRSAGGPDERAGNGTDIFDTCGGEDGVGFEAVKCVCVADDRRSGGGEGGKLSEVRAEWE